MLDFEVVIRQFNCQIDSSKLAKGNKDVGEAQLSLYDKVCLHCIHIMAAAPANVLIEMVLAWKQGARDQV